MKKNDQMYTLLAICLTLCPQVRKALGLISVSLVDHESQTCAEYYKIQTAWTGLPYHKTDSRAFCLCCSELMRTFIHNFVKSVEKDCKGCIVGTYHIRFVFIKSLLSFEQTERDNVSGKDTTLFIRVTQNSTCSNLKTTGSHINIYRIKRYSKINNIE